MGKYSYMIKNNTVCVVDSKDNIIIYDLETWKPEIVKRYRILLAQKRDMEYAKQYLDQMFFDEGTTLIDGALINSAIQLLVKCFTNPQNKGRGCMDSNKVFRKYAKEIGQSDMTKQFSQFYSARNEVIAHDQVNFKENIVGIAINVDNNCAEEIVGLTIRTGYLYKQNHDILLKLVNIVYQYIETQIKKIESNILEEYEKAMEKPELKKIHCENIPMATSW